MTFAVMHKDSEPVASAEAIRAPRHPDGSAHGQGATLHVTTSCTVPPLKLSTGAMAKGNERSFKCLKHVDDVHNLKFSKTSKHVFLHHDSCFDLFAIAGKSSTAAVSRQIQLVETTCNYFAVSAGSMAVKILVLYSLTRI